MNKYIELIEKLQLKSIVAGIQSKYDFDFNVRNPEKIREEIAKIIYFLDHTYLNPDNIRVNLINDELLYYNDNLLKHIRNLLDQARKQGLTDEVQLLSYYLVSLSHSYTKGNIYQIDNNIKTYLDSFYSIFEKREFYNDGSFITDACSFACDIIAYAAKEDKRVYSLDRLLLDCLRICYTKNCSDFQNSINQLIRLGTHYNGYFIAFDNEIAENGKIYFEFELSRISKDIHDDLKVLSILYQKGIISETDEMRIFVTLQSRFSNLKDESDYIRKLAFFKILEKDINTLRNLNNMSQNLKESLKSLIHEVKRASRNLIKYEEPELKSIEHKIDIPHEHFERVLAEYDKDLMRTVLRYCLISFDSFIKDSLESMFSIANLVTVINIDNKEEGLFSGNDTDVPDSLFNAYYSDRIEAYLRDNREKFLNPHIFERKRAYKDFLYYVKEYIYRIQIGIQANLLERKFGVNVERTICKELEFLSDNYYNDYYIILMNMIVQIERFLTQIYNHFENDSKTSFEDGYLERIFEHVQNNELYANGFMHINFTLYDKNGLRIRDKLAHGNFPSGFRDLILLLMVLASYIFVCCFYNETLA